MHSQLLMAKFHIPELTNDLISLGKEALLLAVIEAEAGGGTTPFCHLSKEWFIIKNT
ncbi:hypothetical protein [Synechocystis sp. PCC 7338]|uniref:hypothetical protein n=1 Tax=Synechocystis sp. PCC 7338 TaxID=2732530 RepID=UPI001BAF202C|nr:hypothetical protein [Synechocystis sp. PCC 7338]QUS60619.1 hypothetical protein HTZ78_08010 [Synechocystis sp. PCC 7338]